MTELEQLRQRVKELEAKEWSYRMVIKEMQSDMEAEVRHWKANHDNVVKRLALLLQRPDLPVDRLPAYRELERLQALLAAQPTSDCTEPNRAACPRLCADFCNKQETDVGDVMKQVFEYASLCSHFDPFGGQSREEYRQSLREKADEIRAMLRRL